MRRPLAAVAALLLAAASAHGHGPAPAALGALAMSGAAPAIVRTNIGLAIARGDGAYRYVCPSSFNGGETALAAASADGSLLVTVSGGTASRSTDRGCSFTPVGTETGLSFFDVARSASAAYLLGRAEKRSALVRVGVEGPAELVAEFAGEGVFVPDGLAPIEDEASGGLLLAGALPSPAVFAALAPPAGGPLTLSPLGPLPLGPGIVRLVPRVALASGEAWLVATEGKALRLVHAAPAPAPFAAPPAWSVEPGTQTALQGPAPLGNRWLVVRDRQLEATEIGQATISSWSPLGPVDWACLASVDGVAHACTLPALLRLDPGTGDAPLTSPAFSLSQLGPPDPACARPDDARLACASDWSHFGAESGLLETDPATTPGGPRTPRAPDPAPTASSDSEGCGFRAAPRGRVAALGLFAVLALAGVARARRLQLR